MTATTPKGIEYPTGADEVAPLHTVLATLATTTDDAMSSISNPGHFTGTNADRLALASPELREGIYFYATDTNIMWFYQTSWKMIASRPIMAYVIKTVAQSTSASPAMITWSNSAAPINSDGIYSGASNTRLTLPFAGIWEVGFQLKSSGTAAITAGIRVNGTTYELDLEGTAVGASGAPTTVIGHGFRTFSANDYIEVRHEAATGGNTINAAGSNFWAKYVGQV